MAGANCGPLTYDVAMDRPASSLHFPWYDSLWLSAFERARETVARVAPARLGEFEHAFDVFRTRPDFRVQKLAGLFDSSLLERLCLVADRLAATQLEPHEARLFRRFVVHDHPEYTELQHRIVDAVSEAAGEQVEPSYNFLSLYGAQGVCPLHMDSPQAKWTLDLCLRQSGPWPIHFGPVQQWPRAGHYPADWAAQVHRSIAGRVTTFTPEPGDALLFSGSSQWHYRDRMPAAAGQPFCDLLFFHFIPRGTAELVDPQNWARLFAIPELRQDALAGA